ncbi:MAG: hypothetical protein GX447_01175 [Elusimicrobia bacterium]|nr:hypothetical protein [Elusimicrobiota bacterium]
MNQSKIKVLNMLEEGKINSYEALELLAAVEEDDNSRAIGKMRRKGKKLSIKIYSAGSVKESDSDINELFISALMSRINAELKYNGINLFTEELKKIKDQLVSFGKAKIERESAVIEIKTV